MPDLPEGSAQVFEDFHSFLYTGKVYSGHEGEANSPGYDEEWARLEFSWILGEVLGSVTFKDAVADATVDKMATTGYHPEDMYLGIYSNGSKTSSIRKLMVDIAIHHWGSESLAKIDAEVDQVVNVRFLQDVAFAFSKLKLSSKSTEQAEVSSELESSCAYHEYGTEKPCYKTLFG